MNDKLNPSRTEKDTPKPIDEDTRANIAFDEHRDNQLQDELNINP